MWNMKVKATSGATVAAGSLCGSLQKCLGDNLKDKYCGMLQKSKTRAHLQGDSDVALNVIPNLFSLKQLREMPHGQGVTLVMGSVLCNTV